MLTLRQRLGLLVLLAALRLVAPAWGAAFTQNTNGIWSIPYTDPTAITNLMLLSQITGITVTGGITNYTLTINYAGTSPTSPAPMTVTAWALRFTSAQSLTLASVVPAQSNLIIKTIEFWVCLSNVTHMGTAVSLPMLADPAVRTTNLSDAIRFNQFTYGEGNLRVLPDPTLAFNSVATVGTGTNYFTYTGGETVWGNATNIITPGVWHHVAVVQNWSSNTPPSAVFNPAKPNMIEGQGAAADKTIGSRLDTLIFVDGLLQRTFSAWPATAPVPWSTGPAGTNRLTIGQDLWAGSTNQLQGMITLIRLSTVARYAVNFTPPVVYSTYDPNTFGLWLDGQSSGTNTVLDAGLFGNNLNVQGGPGWVQVVIP